MIVERLTIKIHKTKQKTSRSEKNNITHENLRVYKNRNWNNFNDITIRTMEEKELPFYELTGSILNCCFEIMKELGPGFLEAVYKNALLIAMRQKGLQVEVEQSFEIVFRGKVIGRYRADLFVEKTVIVGSSVVKTWVKNIKHNYSTI
jgi:GxxExxY protein